MPFRRIGSRPPAAPAVPFARARNRPPVSPPEPIDAQPSSPPDSDPPPVKAKRAHHKTDRTGPNWDENGDYLVGKYRPPKSGRWPPGTSGNPAGPEKRKKPDPETEIDNAILAEFPMIVNGRQVNVNMGTFAVHLLKSNAAKSKNYRALMHLLDLYCSTLNKSISHESQSILSPEEKAALEEVFRDAGIDAMPSIRNRLAPSA